MKLMHLNAIPTKYRQCVATIGNFDGIHLGHQQLLKQLQSQREILGLPMVVILFEPQPQEYFLREGAPSRLMCLREKIVLLKELDVDAVLFLKFTQQLANLSADDFMQSILRKQLSVNYLLVGDDFRFGHDRQGDVNVLQRFGQQYHFMVESMKSVMLDTWRVSSTHIRKALATGDFHTAKQLLGRNYSMCGRVIRGDQRGRTIGFPTANLLLRRLVSPLWGVYVVRVIINRQTYIGVANIGKRPTVCGLRQLLEVHLFDFDQDIYGFYIQVQFLKKLRDEQRFASFKLLQAQIQQDVEQAKKFFNDKMS